MPFATVRTKAADRLLQDRLRTKVTVIVAPVGYGKTVLMTALYEHYRALKERCFWTSLDDRDTNLHRVLCLLEVLSYRPGEAQHPTQALFRGDDPFETRISTLIEAAERYPRPMTVFVDNLEFCQDPELGHLLDRLVFETPPSVRFIFASTAELPLNLAKAKLQGLVRQVGIVDLSLDAEHVAELMGPKVIDSIGKRGIKSIEQQSEGWPAAVRMLKILLDDSEDPSALLKSFRGSDEDLSSLLQRQVVSQFSEGLKDFLYDISYLRTFTVELCAYVTDCPDVAQFWETLIRRNVFIIPVDRNQRWYRLHGLFREFLINQAHQFSGASRRHRILSRAAQWCERGGYWRDAIDYALEGDATEQAVDLLDRYAANFVRNLGDNQQYIAWARIVHERQLALGWDGEYWFIWALVLNQQYDSGRKQLDTYSRQLEASLEKDKDNDHLHDLRRRIEIIQICIDVFTDRLTDASHRAGIWLSHSEGDDAFDVVVANCAQSAFFASEYRFQEARESALTSQSASFQSGSPYAKGWNTIFNAMPTVMEGNYAGAYPELTSSLKNLRGVLSDGTGICGTLAFLASECAVEMGLDHEASDMVQLALRTAQSHGLLDVIARGLGAAVKQWTGRPGDAIDLLHLREIANCYPPRLAYMFSCTLIRRMLRLGMLREAREEAVHCGLHLDKPLSPARWAVTQHSLDLHQATVIDLRVAEGKASYGDDFLDSVLREARKSSRALRVVELSLTQMVLALQESRQDAAHRHLSLAISYAASRQIVRPFDDLAQSVASIVEETRPSSWGFALDVERHFFKDICTRLPVTNRRFQDKLDELQIEGQIFEPLTPRQTELLQLIEAGLSNQQIADRLNLSLQTIKGHLFNLYAKLEVKTRSAAVAKARASKLL